MPLEITAKSVTDRLKIYMNGILHLRLETDGLQVESWKEAKCHFCIDFHTKTGVVHTEYNSEEKWKRILELIDEHL